MQRDFGLGDNYRSDDGYRMEMQNGIQNSNGCRGSLTDSLTDKNQKNDPLQLPSVAAAAVLD